MLKSRKNAFRLGGIAALLFMIGGAVALIFALMQDYDVSLRHFAVASVPATIAALFCLLGALFAAGLAVTAAATHTRLTPGDGSTAVLVTSMLAAFLLLATFILEITEGDGGILTRVRPALCALSAVYLFLVTSEKSREGAFFPALAILPILYALLSVLTVYFDASYALNAPIKTYQILAYLALALFFTAETRFALGRIHTPLYVGFATATVVLPGVVSIARLYMTAVGMPGHTFPPTESVAMLAISLFAAARIFSLTDVEEEEEPAEDVPAPSDTASEENAHANG